MLILEHLPIYCTREVKYQSLWFLLIKYTLHNAWREVSKVIHLIFGYLTFLGGDRIKYDVWCIWKWVIVRTTVASGKKKFTLGSKGIEEAKHQASNALGFP